MDLSALLGSMSSTPSGPTVQDEYNKPSGLMTLEDYQSLEKKEPPIRSDELYDEISPAYMTNESQKWEHKKEDGYYFVGANISSLFDTISQLSQILPSSTQSTKTDNNTTILNTNNNITRHKKAVKRSKKIYNKIGEFIDADYDESIIDSVGFRNDSGLILKPEVELDDISSMREILAEAKKYNGHQVIRKITPFGLLKMTRILSKYRKSDNQWIRVATTCELIYKYLSQLHISRNDFFQSQNELPIEALLELEEFYNTDHIFMTPSEMVSFRNELEYYKYNYNGDGMQSDVNKAIKAVTELRPDKPTNSTIQTPINTPSKPPTNSTTNSTIQTPINTPSKLPTNSTIQTPVNTSSNTSKINTPSNISKSNTPSNISKSNLPTKPINNLA